VITLEALSSALAAHEPLRASGGASAAVLVPVLTTTAGLQLLFTKRPETLRSHPGQVSFPGGRIDPEDASPRAAALRETHEELGIAASQITIIGELDDLITGTGFTIRPFVGVLTPPAVLIPSPVEVEEAFFFSLDALAADTAWRNIDLTRDGHAFRVWFFDGAPHTIWGATGAMTRQLCSLLVRRHG